MSKVIESPLYSEMEGISCSVSESLNENRITLYDSTQFTAFGVEKIERYDGEWWAEFRTGPYSNRVERLSAVHKIEFVER